MKVLLAIFVLSSSAFANPVASGKLVLAKELTAKAKGIRTLFVSVYDPGARIPMPCAAQKFTLEKDAEGEFLSFALDTTSLTLMTCQAIPETLNLKIRLDKDGSAGRDQPGDLTGALNGVKKGARDLKITIDKAV